MSGKVSVEINLLAEDVKGKRPPRLNKSEEKRGNTKSPDALDQLTSDEIIKVERVGTQRKYSLIVMVP